MSYEELKERDIFLPEEEWGKADLHTSVNLAPFGIALAVGILGCLLMALGGGSLQTWIGAVLYMGFMIGFALVSSRAVDRQNERVDALHRESARSQDAD
jgi:hypothetical protein